MGVQTAGMCCSAETTATQCGAQVRMSQAMGFEGVDLSKFKGMPAAEMEAFAIHDGASFLRVHWVAVPEAVRARRVNRRRRQLRLAARRAAQVAGPHISWHPPD